MNWRDKPCDVWTGSCDTHGYGHRRSGGVLKLTHRLAWEEAHGPIPSGMCVLHHCDNRPCREITHLFLGTKLDNARDRDAKGRQPPMRGERNGRACLSDADVTVMRSLDALGEASQNDLAKAFGVSHSQVNRIVRNMQRVPEGQDEFIKELTQR